MSMTIMANLLANNAHRNLKSVGTKQSKASARLSSGRRINNAADDAAGLAISEKMKAQIRGMKQAERNVQDGIALIQTAEGGMGGISEMVMRQRELVTQSLNDTLSDEDKAMIQLEIDELTEEIDSMAGKTSFNRIPLLDVPPIIVTTDRMTEVPDVLTVLGRPPVVDDYGTLNLTASRADGTNTTTFVSENSVLLTATNEQGKVTSFPLTSMTGTTKEEPGGSSWTTTWIIKDSNFDFSVTQRVSLALSFDPDGNAMWGKTYNITYGIEVAQDDPLPTPPYEKVTFDLQVSFNTVSKSAETDDDINPNLLIDSSQIPIDKNTKYVSNDYPRTLDINIYSPNNPDMYLESNIPYMHLYGASELWIGNYDEIISSSFDQYLGASITDSAYSLIYKNHDITKGNTRTLHAGSIGLTDPQVIQRPSTLHIQCGANANIRDSMFINRYDCRADSLGIRPITIDPLETAKASLGKLDNALDIINGYRANAGAQQNVLEYTATSLAVSAFNLEDANSRIADADMAKEMMEFTKASVLQQSAVAMLTQANQKSASVLQLLRNP